MVQFNTKEIVIGGTKWKTAPFKFDSMFILGGGGSYVDVLLSGVSPLVLTNALELNFVKALGATNQNGTPTPNDPIDIVSNNGVLKIKNLFDVTTSRVATEGILQDDGSYYLSLASIIGIWTLENLQPFNGKLGTTYTISLKYKTTDTAIGVAFYYSDGTNDIGIRGGGDDNWHTSYVTSNPAKQVAGFGLAYGANLPVYVKDIQIEYGSTATDYVPYGEIYTDGTVETIQVTRKNLFNINNAVRITRATSAEIPLDETPTITIENNGFVLGTPYHLYFTDYMIAFAGQTNTQYTLSVKQMASVDEVGIAFIYSDGTVSRIRYQDTTLTYRTYTSSANKTVVGFALDYGNGSQTLTLQDIQIEFGTTATSFEPYYDGGTATAEMLLKVDNYTDEHELIAGDVVRNVGVKVFDGTENWVYNSSQYPTFSLQISGANGNLTAIPCTHFAGHSGTWASMSDGYVMLHGTNLGFRYDNITSLNDWKQWLSDQYANGTPVIIVYPLATPTTETVSGQTLATIGNCIVTATGSLNNLELDLSYKQSI